jgi:hypothetical protein
MSDYFTSASATPFGAALQRVETLSENLDNINVCSNFDTNHLVK